MIGPSPFFFDVQASGRIGSRGADGPAGPAGAAGAPGPSGSNGTLTIVQFDFDNADLHTLDGGTPIIVTADQPGVLQLVVFAHLEINKTHLSGAGAVPSFLCQYRGTAVVAVSLGAMDLGNTRNFGSGVEMSNITTNSGAVGVQNAAAGLGIQAAFSASYAPSTFSGDARLSLVIAEIPLRF